MNNDSDTSQTKIKTVNAHLFIPHKVSDIDSGTGRKPIDNNSGDNHMQAVTKNLAAVVVQQGRYAFGVELIKLSHIKPAQHKKVNLHGRFKEHNMMSDSETPYDQNHSCQYEIISPVEQYTQPTLVFRFEDRAVEPLECKNQGKKQN